MNNRWSTPIAIVMLLSMLGVAAALAYEAQNAARSHRTTAENVLREYAAFAAWEFSRVARRDLTDTFGSLIGHVAVSCRSDTPPDLAQIKAKGGWGDSLAAVRSVFTASTAASDLVSSGEPLPSGIHALLKAADAKINHGDLPRDSLLLRFDRSGSRGSIVAWRVAGRPGANPAIIGYVADPALMTEVFTRIVRQSPLLPPSLAGDSSSLLTVRVLTPDGYELFASSNAWSRLTNQTSLDSQLGDLLIGVALTESAAGRLIIGGLPRNRVPLLIGLLSMTGALMAVAFVQLRREREVVRLRADFVSGVSHELRTPLAQIRMFGETLLLNRVRSAEERRRSLEIIVQESQRLTQLIENVLQFGRLDRGVAVVTPIPQRLDRLLHEIVEGFEPLARSKRTSIERRIEDGIVVPVDAGAIRQVVLNLLDNALKYGPAGQTIIVGCRCDDDAATVSIEDEGPGVAPADAARIWNPYYRAAQDNGAAGGTGIGLSIVRRLVDMHGGRVRAERGPRGAQFIVELLNARHEPHQGTIPAAPTGV